VYSSVISMAAIIQGLNKFVQDRVERLGSRTYFISRFPFGTDPSRLPERIRTRKYLEYNYAEFVRNAAPDVRIVTTFGTRASSSVTAIGLSAVTAVQKVVIRGAEPEYTEAIRCSASSAGRFISVFDQEHARPVAVLGAAISESLFPNTDALGKTVRVNGAALRSDRRIRARPGLFLGPGVDIFVVIPLSNFKKQYPEANRIDYGIHCSGERQRGNRARRSHSGLAPSPPYPCREGK